MRLLKVPCVCLIFLLGTAESVQLTRAAESEDNSWRLTKPEVPEGPRNEVLLSLDESWADYEQAIAKASEKLLKLFESAGAAAQKKGDLGAVQALTDAQNAFEDQGLLPTDKSFSSAVAGLKKQVATANAALMRSYAKAVTTFTKNGDVEQAKRLQAEQDSVFAGVAVAGGPRKVPPKQWVVDLSNEATLKKEWVLHGKYGLEVVQQGRTSAGKVTLGAGSSMATVAKFQGDLAMDFTYSKSALGAFGDLRIYVCGQELVLKSDGMHQVQLLREGGQVKYSVDGNPPITLLIKQQDQGQASTIKLQFMGYGEAAPTMSCAIGPIVILGRIADE